MGIVSWSYYTSTYEGTTIPQSLFNEFERDAERDVNYFTFGRLKRLSEPSDTVKMCICNVAELLYTRKSQFGDTPALSSYSNDGLSGTFADKQDTGSFSMMEKFCIAKWLADTGMLYRGLD